MRKPEINNNRDAIMRQHYIRRFDVIVRDSAAVQVAYGAGELTHPWSGEFVGKADGHEECEVGHDYAVEC